MLLHIPFYAGLLGKELNENVTASYRHVLLYGAIEVHASGHLGCIASNQTLSDETGLSFDNIRRYVSELKDGGWVDYTIGEDNLRSKIVPLLEIKIPVKKARKKTIKKPDPCVKITQALVYKLHKPCVKITHIDNIIDNKLDNSEFLKATALPSVVDSTELKENKPTVNEVIDLFKDVDINYTTLYKKNPERKAVEQLLAIHSLKTISEVIKKAVIYNKLPYVTSYDKIYKPTELLRNWQKLKDKEAEIIIKPKMEQKQKNDLAKFRVIS